MSNDHSPMSREALIFELGRSMGMLSRILARCERLLQEPMTAEMRVQVQRDIRDARELMREQWQQFYGVDVEGGTK